MEQTTIKLFSPGGIHGAELPSLTPLSFFGFRRMEKTHGRRLCARLFSFGNIGHIYCDTVRGAEL